MRPITLQQDWPASFANSPPVDFAPFDTRGYPTVSALQGYGEWAQTYEGTVKDLMDLRLLARLSLPWRGPALDLACGTGRVGQWLSARGVEPLDGLDLTPGMLDKARARGCYRRLEVADVRATPFDGGYALVTCSLADEHLRDLKPFYAEAARQLASEGRFVLVGYHPFFSMRTGMPTHFERADGQKVAIETYVHLLSDHVRAARAAGLALEELEEGLIDDEWMAVKPKWREHLGCPFSFAAVWR